MVRKLPVAHHVVSSVRRERLDAATQFLESLGFRFQTRGLADVSLRVNLDWDPGVELVTSSGRAAMETAWNSSRSSSVRYSECHLRHALYVGIS
jgi:hypothetical protein